MDSLPNDYSCYTFTDMSETIGQYNHRDIEFASINGDEKAQKAIIVKIEVGLLEYIDKTKIERIDALFNFWHLIKNKQSRLICGAIVEIVMGDIFYHSARSIEKDALDHAHQIIKKILPTDSTYNDRLDEYLERYST